MARQQNDSTALEQVLAILADHGLEDLGRAVEVLLNEAMRIERQRFLGANPYERSAERRGHANGFKPKRLKSRVGELQLEIPQVRNLEEGAEPFYPSALERGQRSERALHVALAEMYVQGVSTRKVARITEELCGFEVTSSQVSRAAAQLDEALVAWRERPLGRTPYLILDARYEKVRHGGQVISCAVLVALGVTEDGRRRVLGVSVSLSEAELHWRRLLASLKERGLCGVQLIISDDHAGLRAAREAEFTAVPWQRCQFHLQRNAVALIPKTSMRREVARVLRSVFQADSRAEADERLRQAVARFQDSAPRLAEWIEQAIPEGLTILDFPEQHRRRLRTTNAAERIHQEIRRRTRVAGLFPHDDSLLRLVSAVPIEFDEEWATGKRYLTMETD
ncbi:MAG: IS256 family transposase [Alphaproteobacteria bacterium]|nr:MAG: IS256 family transposase [Alphaproteobacteria bacterium]